MTVATIEPTLAKTDAGGSEPVPPVGVHELADIPLSRREQFNQSVNWSRIEEALRDGMAVSLACLEGDVDTVTDLAADVLEELGMDVPQHTYDASDHRLWFWITAPPHPSLNGDGGDGAAVQASADPDADSDDDAEPADSVPDLGREDPGYIECCASEFRTLDADRVPFREVDWTVVASRFFMMDWESAEFAFNRGKVVAIACKREERAVVESVALGHLSNDLCSHYNDGLVWFRRPAAAPED